MATYTAPLADMRFVFHEFLGPEGLGDLPGMEELSPDLVDAVLEEAAKIAQNVLFPLNRSGDEEGCHFEDGEVRTPAGFKDAYGQYCAGGWTSVAADPDYGGQGLPYALETLINEMMNSANLSFHIYPSLSHGAYNAIEAHADEATRRLYLPKLVEGRWSGTMCLTEPQCGTDLGLVRTRAEPNADGSYRMNGTKIFISAGEHDLTENILHLVLARLPDAPPGIKGISLFLVPKFRVNPDGSLGERNGVHCGAIEHKMGIKASSTCVINFDDAQAHLLSAPHRGMRAMFTMMNAARLAVGLQGVALAEASYQGAVSYARERLQGRALKGPAHPDMAADPLIVHPDVRRMLLTMRAYIEGMRALTGLVAARLDISRRAADEQTRRDADEYVALMTPIVKAFFTDVGFELTNLGVQVYGGHGYIREHGMEQYVRDARITQIYEGANGIQALDLVGRKLSVHTGRYLRHFFHPVSEYIEARQSDAELAEFTAPLAKAFGRLQQATAWMAQQGLTDPEEPAAAASDYLRLFGLVALAHAWTRTAELAAPRVESDETGFYRAKLDTGRFFMQRILPQSGALFAAIMAGGKSITRFEEAAF